MIKITIAFASFTFFFTLQCLIFFCLLIRCPFAFSSFFTIRLIAFFDSMPDVLMFFFCSLSLLFSASCLLSSLQWYYHFSVSFVIFFQLIFLRVSWLLSFRFFYFSEIEMANNLKPSTHIQVETRGQEMWRTTTKLQNNIVALPTS